MMGRLQLLLLSLSGLLLVATTTTAHSGGEKPKVDAVGGVKPNILPPRVTKYPKPEIFGNDTDAFMYGGVYVESKDGSCPDATEYDYVMKKDPTAYNLIADNALKRQRKKERGRQLAFKRVYEAKSRVGCGMNYNMEIKLKDFYKKGKKDTFRCTYYVSEYESHLGMLAPKYIEGGEWSVTTIEGTPEAKAKTGPCRDEDYTKYQRIENITAEVTAYANKAVLADDLQAQDMYSFVKVKRAEKKPSCGLYVRLIFSTVAADVNGQPLSNDPNQKEFFYDYEYFKTKDIEYDVLLIDIPPPPPGSIKH